MGRDKKPGKQWGNVDTLQPLGKGLNSVEMANVRLTKPCQLLISADVDPLPAADVVFTAKLGIHRAELDEVVIVPPVVVVAQSLIVTARNKAAAAPVARRVSVIVVPLNDCEEETSEE